MNFSDNEGSRNVIRSERSAGKCGHGKDEKHFSHWLVVVFSKKAFMREPKTLEKRIKKENREGNAEKGEVHRRYKRVRQRETE